MDTPISRLSGWDIPHVPPSPEPSPGPETAPPDQTGPGENFSPQAGPSAPLAQPGPGAAQVRFLNAVTQDGGEVRISSGNRLLSSSLPSGSLSEYFSVSPGFRSFSFHNAAYPWMLLHRSAIPLPDGDRVTLALVRSGAGLDLVRVDDRPCGVQGSQRAALRCVDLIYNSPGLDLILPDGRVVFTDMRFKEVTNYRRATPGRYGLYAVRTPAPSPLPDLETVEELPTVIADWAAEPLSSFFLDLRAGEQLSLYFLGDWTVNREFRVLPVENF